MKACLDVIIGFNNLFLCHLYEGQITVQDLIFHKMAQRWYLVRKGKMGLCLYMPEAGFKPGSLSECLLEFDTRSNPLGHHGRLGGIHNDVTL